MPIITNHMVTLYIFVDISYRELCPKKGKKRENRGNSL